MTAVQWIPFSLAFLHTYLERGRRRDLLLAVGCFSLQALSSGHGAAYLFVAIVALLGWHVAFGGSHRHPPAAARLRRGRRVPARARRVGHAALSHRAERSRPAARLSGRRAARHRELPRLAIARSTIFLQARFLGPFKKEADAYLFPGILRPGARGDRARQAGRRDAACARTTSPFTCCIAVLSTLMFVDRPFELWRYVLLAARLQLHSRAVAVHHPDDAGAGGAGGIGVRSHCRARVTKRARDRVAVAIAALLLAEYSSYPFAGVPYTVDVPAIDRWLDTQPKPFVIAEVPVPSPGNLGALERHQTRVDAARHRALAEDDPRLQRHSPAAARQLYLELTAFPDADEHGRACAKSA